MSNRITNYDGGITTLPQKLVYVESVEQIQSILRDAQQFPSAVRAMGSYHSLTPCVSSDGTILNMSRMDRVLKIDRERKLAAELLHLPTSVPRGIKHLGWFSA